MNKPIVHRLRVALYVRVSSHEQIEGYSISEQTERLQKYAEAMGWDVYKIYVDPGFSGGNTDRPALTEMIRDIKNGDIDKVAVYKLDRLSRSQKDTMILIEDVFLAHNVDFVSMNENFDTSTPFGRAMVGLLSIFSQLERENIKERTMMGKEARAKEGKWGGGSSEPIGYNYNPETEELEINEYEKMQIMEAVDLLFKGTPLRTITNTLNNKGYTYRGRSGIVNNWEAKRLKYVFRNKTYLGYIKYAGQYYKGNHEPIYDEETFAKIQAILDMRDEEHAGKYTKTRKQSTYLGGMIYCKHCGARYCRQAGKKWKDGEPPLYYSCYSRNKSVPKMIKDPNCKNKNWRMPDLDNIVLGEIKKLAVDPEYFHTIVKDETAKKDAPTKIDTIKKEIQTLDEQISRFMDLYGLGTFTIDQVSEKVNPLNDQRKKLNRELEILNAEAGVISEEETREIVETFDEVIEHGDLDEIRLLISSLIYYIELDNDDVYIYWKFA